MKFVVLAGLPTVSRRRSLCGFFGAAASIRSITLCTHATKAVAMITVTQLEQAQCP